MKKHIKNTALFLASTTLFASCASTTLIQSNPAGAKVYLSGEYAGTTPYSHKDTKIVGSTTDVRIEKEGYEPFVTSFSRNERADVGAIIGGVFVLFPFLWTMKYKDQRMYELQPLNGQVAKSTSVTSTSITEKLQELKKLFDEKLITKEEYDKQREKVLND